MNDLALLLEPSQLKSQGKETIRENRKKLKAGGFRIDPDDARAIAQTKPAAGDRAFFDHHTAHGYLGRCIAGLNCENGSRLAFRRFAQDGALRFMTTGGDEEANQWSASETAHNRK